MANRKISELGALTAPAADDLLAVVDVSEGANVNKNKKITYGELFKSVIDGTETAPAIAFDTAGTTGLYKSAANELSIATNGGRAIQIEANNKTTIYGDLVVTGGTTTVSSSTITVADKNIELATGNSSDTGATGGGLTIKGATDKTWNWIDSTDSWTSNQNIDLVSGMSYKIQANQVLTATTLGSGVVNSSLTSVGTLGSLAVTGEIDAGSLDVSGNADIDGTMEADAYTVNGTALDVFIQDTVGAMVSSNTETNIVVSYDSTNNNLDFEIVSYPAASISGTTLASNVVTSSLTSVGTLGALTVTGEIDAGSLDISGDADIDGTMEADAYTVNGTALDVFIQDTVGAMVSNNTETNITVTYDGTNNNLDFVIGTLNQDTTGNAATATALQTARTIGGVSFNGTANINLPGVNQTGNQNTTGSAATLTTARTIGGVSFDGSANINLPGVNAAGNQNTSGTAAGLSGTPTITVNDVVAASLDISGNADIDGILEADAYTVNGTALNVFIQDTVGAMVSNNTETNIAVTYDSTNNNLDFVIGTLNQDTTGNAATATALQTARTIGGVSFDGTANITLPGVNAAGNQNTTGNAATATALATARTIGGTSFDGTANITPANATNAVNLSGTLASGVTGTTQATSDNSTKIATTAYVTTAVANLIDSAPGALDTLNELAAAIGDDANFSTTITNSLATKLPLAGGTMTGAINLGSNNITNGGTITGTFVGNITGNVTGNTSGSSGSCTGNAATATALATARTIGGVSFDGSANINLPGVNAVGNQNTTGSAATLTTARTIGGVSFNGSANINLPGVNAAGNQNTSGNAATATALATARAINGVNFDGTAAITVAAAAGTLTGNTLASGVTASSLTSVGTLTGLTVSGNISMTGTGVIDVPSGTTGQRPGSPTTGMFRYNTTDAQFEGFTATGWGAIAGGGGGASNFTYLALRNAANNGSAVFDGSQNEFTLVSSGTTTAISPSAANVLLTSLGGVIQQPNEGTSTSGITGFCIDGSTIKFGANLTMAPDFIIHQIGAGIGTPSDNTVDLAHLAHKTQGDILFYGASGTPSLLNAGTSGKFLRTNGSSANPTWETVDLANLSASNLTSGTVPDARFPSTLPAASGANLTALNASNLSSGTVAAARLDTATTQSAGNNSTKIATTAYADTAVSNLVDSAPGALNTLNELAAALGDDANFSTTVTNSIATKLPLAGGTLTGNISGIGFLTQSNVNSTGDSGLSIKNGSRLGFDQSGTRSWTVKAASGNLVVASGDGSGALVAALFSGSGASLTNVNATTLDSIDSGSFLRSDADDSASGSYSFTNSYNEFGNGTGSVSNDGNWNARVNVAGTQHARIDVKSVSDGIISTMSAHTGHTKAQFGTRSNHGLAFICNGSERATLSTSGSLSSTVQGVLWGASNDGSGSGLDADTLDGVHANKFLTSYNNAGTTGWEDSNRNFRVNGGSSGSAGLVFYDSAGAFQFQLYGDGSNYGFLNSNWGSWDMKKVNGGNLTLNNNDSNIVWHAGNDGSGSGLDADLLDGVHGTNFVRSDQDDTLTGKYNVTSQFLVGGTYGANAYNAVSSTRLLFGGGNDPDNYHIGTNMENYGGNYTKFDIRWHTGIRMGAQTVYGGIRFYNNEDLGTLLFSIGKGDSNVRTHTNMYCTGHVIPSATNTYDLGTSSLRWNNLYVNDMHFSNEGKEGGNDVDGTTGDWTLQEGADTIFMINNKTGKKYKMALQEVS